MHPPRAPRSPHRRARGAASCAGRRTVDLPTPRGGRRLEEPSRRRLRVAICLTGRERQLALIRSNVGSVLRSIFDFGSEGAHVFAVQPVDDHWANVKQLLFERHLNSSTTIERQRSQNLTAPAAFRPKSAGRGFVVEIGDCAHCQDMIDAYEAQHGVVFDVVARMRTDLSWEILPAMPPARLLAAGHVHFPWMSHCKGWNDKFAVGARDVMRRYLRRKDHINYNVRSAYYSEQFLRHVLPKNVQVHQHKSWMFCKTGRISPNRSAKANTMDWWKYSRNAWPECSLRHMGRIACERLVCDWCGRGCACYNDTCIHGHVIRVVSRTKVCHSSAGRTLPSAQEVLGKQLFE